MKCPKCGTENPNGKFCRKCGTPLMPAAQPPVPPQNMPARPANVPPPPANAPVPPVKPIASASAAQPEKKQKSVLPVIIILLIVLLIGGGLALLFLLRGSLRDGDSSQQTADTSAENSVFYRFLNDTLIPEYGVLQTDTALNIGDCSGLLSAYVTENEQEMIVVRIDGEMLLTEHYRQKGDSAEPVQSGESDELFPIVYEQEQITVSVNRKGEVLLGEEPLMTVDGYEDGRQILAEIAIAEKGGSYQDSTFTFSVPDAAAIPSDAPIAEPKTGNPSETTTAVTETEQTTETTDDSALLNAAYDTFYRNYFVPKIQGDNILVYNSNNCVKLDYLNGYCYAYVLPDSPDLMLAAETAGDKREGGFTVILHLLKKDASGTVTEIDTFEEFPLENYCVFRISFEGRNRFTVYAELEADEDSYEEITGIIAVQNDRITVQTKSNDISARHTQPPADAFNALTVYLSEEWTKEHGENRYRIFDGSFLFGRLCHYTQIPEKNIEYAEPDGTTTATSFMKDAYEWTTAATTTTTTKKRT